MVDDNFMPDFIELGDTGLRRFGGFTTEEFIPELRQRNGAEIYDEMRKNDSTINAVLSLMNQLFYNVKWHFETNLKDNDSENKKEIVEGMFEDMEKPFSQVLSDVLTFIPFGYSLLEIVWKKRQGKSADKRFYSNNNFNDGLFAPRKLPLRSQKTILSWGFDPSGTATSVVQLIPETGRQVEIPLERLLHFRTTSESDNPEGLSVLRGSYESYMFIKKIKRIEAVSIERDLAGIPSIIVPAKIMSKSASAEDKKTFEEVKSVLHSIRNNSSAGVVLPSNLYDGTNQRQYDFQLIKAGGQKQVDTHKTIERYQSDIAIQLLADFIHMGAKKAGGTYNLAEVKIKLFSQSLNYYLDIIENVFNTNLIPKIYELNEWRTDNMCRLKHGNIDTIDFELYAKSLMCLLQSGGLTPDESLEKEIRRRANLPQIGEVIEDVK